MGGQNVKNTMVDRAWQFVAPYPCFGCGKFGAPLCEDCNYDIKHELFGGCILCGRAARSGICPDHDSHIAQAWVVGERQGVLQRLTDALKFQSAREVAQVLAGLLDQTLPLLPADTVIVPVPTNRAHVRQRGIDHARAVAKQFAAIRGLRFDDSLVGRAKNSVQRQAEREDRFQQAAEAFQLRAEPGSARYLVIDDTITTGASVEAVAGLLASKGAWVGVGALGYQMLIEFIKS